MQYQKVLKISYSGWREMIPDGNSDLQEGKKSTGNYVWVNQKSQFIKFF